MTVGRLSYLRAMRGGARTLRVLDGGEGLHARRCASIGNRNLAVKCCCLPLRSRESCNGRPPATSSLSLSLCSFLRRIMIRKKQDRGFSSSDVTASGSPRRHLSCQRRRERVLDVFDDAKSIVLSLLPQHGPLFVSTAFGSGAQRSRKAVLQTVGFDGRLCGSLVLRASWTSSS